MIFFNLKALEKKLIDGKVSDKDAFNYFMILSLLSGLSMYLLDDEATNSQIRFFDILLTITLTYFGLKQCFNVNTVGDNKEFYKRLFSLSLVILIRIFCCCILLLIPFISILFFLGFEIDSKGSLLIEIVDFLFDKVLQLLFYFIMYKSLRKISTYNIVNG